MRIDGSGTVQAVMRPLAEEHALTLWVNGQPAHKFLCSPDHLRELCVGWLADEGMIRGLDELRRLYIPRNGGQARAEVEPLRPKAGPKPFSAFAPVRCGQIRGALELLQAGGAIHAATRATHVCVLLDSSGEAILCEDIGRYNAVDKAVGTAFLGGKTKSGVLLFTSGRIAEELVKKVCQAGIPVLVSKASATRQAVVLAERLRLTLCFQADETSFFTGKGGTVLP
jgi:FdhD protein